MTGHMLHAAVAVLAVCGVVAAPATQTGEHPAGSAIRKISFLIHPVSWDLARLDDGAPNWHYIRAVSRLRAGAYYRPEEFESLLARERLVNARQRAYIERMGSDEALVIFPIGGQPPMLELIEAAQARLGPRAIVIRSPEPQQLEAADYRALLTAEMKTGLMDEIIEAVQEEGYGWTAHAIKVLLYNRLVAEEIRTAFAAAGLSYDPTSVEAVAFGEGFEQCAMDWKALLGEYLGLAQPIENDYELSVSGMPLTIGARFAETIARDEGVRLYLWELADGRSMAFFARVSSRFADPQLFVTVPDYTMEVYSEVGARLYPAPARGFSDQLVKLGPPQLIRVPVYDGRRMYQQLASPVGRAAYIVSDAPLAEFTAWMREADIGS